MAPRLQREGLALTHPNKRRQAGVVAGGKKAKKTRGWLALGPWQFFAALRFARLPKIVGQMYLICRAPLVGGVRWLSGNDALLTYQPGVRFPAFLLHVKIVLKSLIC